MTSCSKLELVWHIPVEASHEAVLELTWSKLLICWCNVKHDRERIRSRVALAYEWTLQVPQCAFRWIYKGELISTAVIPV